MASAEKQIPRPSDLDLEFFRAATSTGALHVQRCTECSNYHHPPRLFCPACFSGRQAFKEVSGTGTVYSYTVSHYTTEKAWQNEVPWTTIVVELDEGPRLVGTARNIEPTEVVIGLRVRLVPQRVNDDFAYLWVEPTEDE